TVTFSIGDNSSGDDNPTLGVIHDPSGVAVLAAAPAENVAVPTLEWWALMLMLSGLLGMGLRRISK
ncbi:MAG: hypothetical protein RLZZ502_791, partial [Pseudomonadota bacterium]